MKEKMARYAFVSYFENVENFDDAVKLKIKNGIFGERAEKCCGFSF
jgi:hypothetical protein